MKEYDVVISNKKIENVPKDTKGTVLIVYAEGEQYEVEFVNDDGGTINVLTVSKADIDKLQDS